MLKLVLAGAKSGKTSLLLDEISKRAADGVRCILIVPEVVSFEYEKLLCDRLSDDRLDRVAVKSFRSLCRDIFKRYGGAAKPRADSAVKTVLARQASEAVGEQIVFYRRHLRNSAFYSMVCAAADELKQSGISPQQLAGLSETGCDDAVRAAKFREFSLIYAAYDALLHDRYADEADELSDAAQLCDGDFFSGASVFFDEFDGFSQPQLRLISLMLRNCDEVWCSLCCDSLDDNGPLAFHVPASTGRTLLACSAAEGAEVAPPILLKNSRFAPAGLAALGDYLLYKTKPASFDGVRRGVFKSRYDEMNAVASEICALVRGGSSYSDFAVVVSDTELYKPALSGAFERCNIPYFCDFHSDLLSSPLAVMASAVLSLAAFGITTDGLLRLLKTGLCDIDDTDADELENYVFSWGVEHGDWLKPFSGNPEGYAETFSDAALERLSRIDAARDKLVSPVAAFAKRAREGAADVLVSELFATLEELGSAKRIDAVAAEKTEESREQVRQYNLCCAMLDALRDAVYGDNADFEQLLNELELLASTTRLHDVPNTVDRVLVVMTGRARAINARTVFVAGLCEGQFPQTEFADGFFTNDDRDYILSRELPIQTSFKRRYCIEQAGFYRALTCAAKTVYLCSPVSEEGGLYETAEIRDYTRLGELHGFETAGTAYPLAQTADSGLMQFAQSYTRRDIAASTLASVLLETAPKRVTALADGARAKEFRVRDLSLCEGYYGDRIRVSPTIVDNFSNCRMNYFLRYVMRIMPLKENKLDRMQSGNFVHFVLQTVLEKLKGRLENASPDEITSCCSQAADSYIAKVMGGADLNSARVMNLAARLKKQTTLLVGHIAREQRQSEFKTEFFELGIGFDGINARELSTPDGKKISVCGKIDRVDVMNTEQGNYVRVVDYKTGNKNFLLSDIYYGLNIQMLVYLFSVCDDGELIKNAVPAGVLYLPADPKVTDDPEKPYQMSGLILDAPEVTSAMDKDGNGVFVKLVSRQDTKAKMFASMERLGNIKRHLDGLIVDMAKTMYAGDFRAQPLVKTDWATPCSYCDYSSVCGGYKDEDARRCVKLDETKLFESGENADE